MNIQQNETYFCCSVLSCTLQVSLQSGSHPLNAVQFPRLLCKPRGPTLIKNNGIAFVGMSVNAVENTFIRFIYLLIITVV